MGDKLGSPEGARRFLTPRPSFSGFKLVLLWFGTGGGRLEGPQGLVISLDFVICPRNRIYRFWACLVWPSWACFGPFSGHLGPVLGCLAPVLGCLGVSCGCHSGFWSKKRNESMESLVQLGEVFGDNSVWTFRRDRPNPTMLKM